MSRSSPSRSEFKADEINLTYEVAMPFEGRPAKINLIDQGDTIEVIVSDIPVPAGYHNNFRGQGDGTEKVERQAVARWHVEDAARILNNYDWNVSSSRASSGNRYLKDVYFVCGREDINDAVLDAKRFLADLEENVFYHSRKYDVDFRDPPSEMLDAEDANGEESP